jgi:platelet-activating factor acetylhydrolase IB subunit alpha
MYIIVSCSADLFIKIWDTQNEWKNTKTLAGHDHAVTSVRFMPGDDFIVSASWDTTIRVWNVAMGYVHISGRRDMKGRCINYAL